MEINVNESFYYNIITLCMFLIKIYRCVSIFFKKRYYGDFNKNSLKHILFPHIPPKFGGIKKIGLLLNFHRRE